jgi:acyl-CoA reductase-like NAD-dependent aldehyde dehydrogenase
VAVLAPQDSSFLGLVSVLAPVIATGNTAVVVTSESAPLPALSLGEVLATSDVPGGVVNLLSGRTAEIAAPLAAHQDVNAIDLAGADQVLAKELEISAADNLKRVRRPQAVDWAAEPGTERLTAFLETKTVWHPAGAGGSAGSAY